MRFTLDAAGPQQHGVLPFQPTLLAQPRGNRLDLLRLTDHQQQSNFAPPEEAVASLQMRPQLGYAERILSIRNHVTASRTSPVDSELLSHQSNKISRAQHSDSQFADAIEKEKYQTADQQHCCPLQACSLTPHLHYGIIDPDQYPTRNEQTQDHYPDADSLLFHDQSLFQDLMQAGQ
ncbi:MULTISPECIES: hypothetical protein [Pseudomonas]|uniref:hypothetical protein n=1 Tax=Pseudomonas TaxID=286 RepID=UPI001F254C75|nr:MULTISPECIES: hypothetical protein [Pseudomonas]MCZ9639105.1 hypothetical protein [Pseudomonas putida]